MKTLVFLNVSQYFQPLLWLVPYIENLLNKWLFSTVLHAALWFIFLRLVFSFCFVFLNDSKDCSEHSVMWRDRISILNVFHIYFLCASVVFHFRLLFQHVCVIYCVFLALCCWRQDLAVDCAAWAGFKLTVLWPSLPYSWDYRNIYTTVYLEPGWFALNSVLSLFLTFNVFILKWI